MAWCVNHYARSNADTILGQADATATKLLGGQDRLNLIRKTFDYLRKQTIDLAPGAPLILGPLAGSKPASLPFRSEAIGKPRLVFDPSGTKSDTWNERGLDQNGPYDQRTFTPKRSASRLYVRPSTRGRSIAFWANSRRLARCKNRLSAILFAPLTRRDSFDVTRSKRRSLRPSQPKTHLSQPTRRPVARRSKRQLTAASNGI